MAGIWLCWGLLPSAFGEGQTAVPKGKSAKGKAATKIQMNNFAYHWGQLMPLVVSPANFTAKEYETKIKEHLTALAAGSHNIEANMPIPEDDPALKYVARKFDRHFNRTLDLFNNGQKGQARRLLRKSSRFCISCHTRHSGGQFNLQSDYISSLKNFSDLERAEYLAAIRQFPEAIKYFELALSKPEFAKRAPDQWATAAKKMLAIVVRVKQDPYLAMELISKIREDKAVPKQLSDDSLIWRGDAKAWSKEKHDPKATVADRMAEIKQWRSRSEKFRKRGSEGGLIYELRASAKAHELLVAANGKPYQQELLFLSGQIAEDLAEINLWTLHETYYEACIRVKPKTAVAKECFGRLNKIKQDQFQKKLWGEKYKAQVESWLKALKLLSVP